CFRLLAATEQVGTGQVADQQRATGKQNGRLIRRDRTVVDEQADVRGRVARSVQHLEADVAKLELLAVAKCSMLVTDLGRRRGQHVDVRPRGDLGQAGQVV